MLLDEKKTLNVVDSYRRKHVDRRKKFCLKFHNYLCVMRTKFWITKITSNWVFFRSFLWYCYKVDHSTYSRQGMVLFPPWHRFDHKTMKKMTFSSPLSLNYFSSRWNRPSLRLFTRFSSNRNHKNERANK